MFQILNFLFQDLNVFACSKCAHVYKPIKLLIYTANSNTGNQLSQSFAKTVSWVGSVEVLRKFLIPFEV